MRLDNNQQAFFKLLGAGLWEKDLELRKYGTTDFDEIMRLAEEQSVVGVVTAGLEHVSDVKVPQEKLLQFIGQALQIEQQNREMNEYIERLITELRSRGVYALLMKGQGIAQCYERPLWRMSGDVDLLLSHDNYIAARSILEPKATNIDEEIEGRKHLALTRGDWVVELHGTLRTNLWKSLERVMDEAQRDIFYNGQVQSWDNGGTQVFLMNADENVAFVFAHILQHFFVEGIGLRQICDWCRLLYTYKDSLNHGLLESRIREAGLMSEWRAFAAMAVNKLGMPVEAMPFYSDASKWRRKGDKILAFVIETGNFGHNRDMSYRQEENAISRKWKTFCHISADTIKQFSIFPVDSVKVWWRMMGIGLRGLVRR